MSKNTVEVIVAMVLTFLFLSAVACVTRLVAKERAEDFRAACAERQGYVEVVNNVKLCLRKESP